jgi:hypothetical protein
VHTAESLVRDLQRLRAARCHGCQGSLCHHQTLMSIALGFREAPICLRCLAGVFECPVETIRDQAYNYIQRRECFQDAWRWAGDEEKSGTSPVPPCLVFDSGRQT